MRQSRASSVNIFRIRSRSATKPEPPARAVAMKQPNPGAGVYGVCLGPTLARRSRVKNRRPVRADRSGGPPRTHPRRCATRSNGLGASPTCLSSAKRRSAFRRTSDSVQPLCRAIRRRRAPRNGSRRMLVAIGASPAVLQYRTAVTGTPQSPRATGSPTLRARSGPCEALLWRVRLPSPSPKQVVVEGPWPCYVRKR